MQLDQREADPAIEALESKYHDVATQFERLGYPHHIVIANDIASATKADLIRVPDDGAYPGQGVFRWGVHAWDFGYGAAEVLITLDSDGEPHVRQIDGPDHVVDMAVHSALRLARRALNPPPKPTKSKEFKLPYVLPSSWEGLPVPRREWWLPDLVPCRTVTLLSGDGGVGKSLLALQMGVASSLGVDTVGLTPSPGRVLYLGAEDEADEFHRRMVDIVAGTGRTLADLGDRFALVPMAGSDATLWFPVPGNAGVNRQTVVWSELNKRAETFRPDLLVLDTSADLFGGNEIDRVQVRQFVGMLRGFAQTHDCAVLLLSHPSVAGMQSGSGLSGSTAWNNSVRSRLYLDWAPAEDGGEPDRYARVLSMKKANYGNPEGAIRLRWDAGRFIADIGAANVGAGLVAKRVDDTFLSLLETFRVTRQNVSASPGPSYAPTKMMAHPGAKGVSKRQLAAAMQRLLEKGIIRNVMEGPPSRPRSRLIASSHYHGPED